MAVNIRVAEEVLTPDCELVTPDTTVRGQAAIAAHWACYDASFPDGAYTIADAYGSADAFTVEGTWHGTNTGPLAGPQGELPATGRRVAISFCTVTRVRDGRVEAIHVYFDQMSMTIQLGLVPEPAAA